MNTRATARTCHHLGVCQSRTPDCAGCAPFAPGVIAAHRAPRPRWQRWALAAGRWAWRTLSVACVLIVLLGLAGMAGGHGRSATCPAPATPAVPKVNT